VAGCFIVDCSAGGCSAGGWSAVVSVELAVESVLVAVSVGVWIFGVSLVIGIWALELSSPHFPCVFTISPFSIVTQYDSLAILS